MRRAIKIGVLSAILAVMTLPAIGQLNTSKITADTLIAWLDYDEFEIPSNINQRLVDGFNRVFQLKGDGILADSLKPIFLESLKQLLNKKRPLSVIILQQALAWDLIERGKSQLTLRDEVNDGKWKDAIDYELKSLELIDTISNPVLKSLAYNTLASSTIQFGNRVQYRLTALRLIEGLGDKQYLARLYSEIANDYGIVFEDAGAADVLYYLDRFLELQPDRDVPVKYPVAKISKAVRLTILGRYAEARKILDLMKPHIDSLASFSVAKYLDAEGQFYELQGKPMEAIPFYLKSLRLFRDGGHTNQACYLAIYLAEAYFKIGENQKGLQYGLEGYQMSLGQYLPLQIRASLILSKLYDGTGQTKDALRFLQIHQQKQEEFNREELLNRLASAEIKVLAEQSAHAREVNERDRLLQKAEIEKQRNLIYATAGGSALIIAFSAFLFRSNKQKAKLNSELAQTVKDLKATQTQLIHSEKMASLGELTAGIAHEIENPLNFVNNFSEVSNELMEELKTELTSGNGEQVAVLANDIKQNLEKINHHGKRADAIVKNMLQHSQTSSGKKEPTNINALCEEYLRLAYHGYRAKDKSFNIKYETQLDPSLPKANIVAQDIGRAILNLINNAFYAVNEKTNGDKSVEPRVTIATKHLGDKVEISVQDNGPGIPDHIKEKIFQPFFTTKPAGQGTGLGLSLSYDIVKAHGGTINVRSHPGLTVFIVQLSL
jgi:signal transduction histidine kinase